MTTVQTNKEKHHTISQPIHVLCLKRLLLRVRVTVLNLKNRVQGNSTERTRSSEIFKLITQKITMKRQDSINESLDTFSKLQRRIYLILSF